MTKKAKLLFILLTIISLSYFSFQYLHPKLLAWYFTGYCYKCFGYTIDYQSARHAADGSLLLKKVCAVSSDFKSVQLKVHRIKIVYQFNWMKRCVNATIIPKHVEIYVKNPVAAETFQKSQKLFLKKKRRAFFFISPSIRLEKIQATIKNYKNNPLALFEIEVEMGKEAKGAFAIQDLSEKQIAKGEFNETHGFVDLTVNFNNFPCSLGLDLWGKENGWEFASGIANGKLALHHENGISSFNTHLLLYQGALVSHSNTAFAFELIDFSHKQDKIDVSLKNGSIKWNDFFVDSLQGEVKLDGDKILTGSVIDGEAYENKICLSLIGNVNDPELQIQIKGKGNRESLKFAQNYVQEACWLSEPVELMLHKKGTVVQGTLLLGADQFDISLDGKMGWKMEEGLVFDLESGNIHSRSLLSLSKYSPMILSRNVMHSLVEGDMELEGIFNPEGISLKQTIHHMHLSLRNINYSSREPFFMYYQWDVHNHHPIIQGEIKGLEIQDIHSGLHFKECQGALHMDDEGITVAHFQANTQGIQMQGSLSSVWNQNALCMHVTELEGSFSSLKTLTSQLGTPLFFHKLPLEGTLVLEGEGIRYRQEWDSNQEKAKITELKIEGRFIQGKMHTRFGNMRLDDLQLAFRYDYQANNLLIYDIEGSLLVGEDQNIETYVVAGDKIYFSDFSSQSAVFDVWVGLRKRDILRLVGTTQLIYPSELKNWNLGSAKASEFDLSTPAQCYNSDDHDLLIHFDFDQHLTHFGVVYPQIAQLTLRNWEKIEQMDLKFSFQLSSALADFQRFVRSGFLGMSPGITKAIGEIKSAKGDLQAHLHWNTNNLFMFDLKGKEIALGSSLFQEFALHGKRNEKMWNIEELKLDQLVLSADVRNEGKNLIFPFFGFHYGSTILAGSDGIYYSDDDHLDGNIHLMEVNIQQLAEIPQFKRLIALYEPKGRMKGKGKLRLEFLKQHWWRAEAYLNGALTHLEIQGLPFADIDDVAIGYLSDQGLTFQALETHLQRGDATDDAISMHVERAGYDLRTEELWVHGLRFNIPKERLEWASDKLVYAIPEFFGCSFSADCGDVIANCKVDEALSGRIDMRLHPRSRSIKLKLNEGWYLFGQTPHFVKDTLFEFSSQEIKLSTLYYFNDQWVLLAAQTHTFDLREGCLILSQQFQKEKPLTVHWKRTDKGGFWIEKAEGSIAGTEVSLKGDEEDANKNVWNLFGETHIDLLQAAKFFPYLGWASMAKSWELGKGYHLNGDWKVPKNNWNAIEFKGMLVGHQAEVMGHQIDKIEAKLQMSEENFIVLNGVLNDKSGKAEVPKLTMKKLENEQWILDMPSLVFTQFNPSELRRIGKKESVSKNHFVFKKLEAHGIQGCIDDPSSFTASGSFSFSNPIQEGEKQTFFYIPNDMLKKVGMDLNALTPVVGSVEFDIEENRIIFSKFKDVYSENKLVKFSLSKESVSAMDFEGNLSVRMTLKPYHVMFRFAEFFSVGISGNIRKPEYNFLK